MVANWQAALVSTQQDFPYILPEVMLAFFGLATLLTDFLLEEKQKSWNALTAMLGVLLSGVSLWLLHPVASELTPARTVAANSNRRPDHNSGDWRRASVLPTL